MKAFGLGLVALVASCIFLWLAIPFVAPVTLEWAGIYFLSLAVVPLVLSGFVVSQNNGKLWVAFVIGVIGAFLADAVTRTGPVGDWLIQLGLYVLAGCVCMAGFGVGRLVRRRP